MKTIHALLRLALIAAAALAAAGCGAAESTSTAAGASGQPRHGGEIFVGAEQEPDVLNRLLATGSLGTTKTIVDTMSESWIDASGNNTWEPVLAATVPTAENGAVVFSGGKMRVTVDIRPEAAWNDRTPITCADMVFTWKTMMTEKWQIGQRDGWKSIEAIECPTPKRFVMIFKEPYAPYLRYPLGVPPLPAHELEGKDFNRYWNDKLTVTSGPFRFVSWRRGINLTVERNENYWNAGPSRRPYLDRISFKFLKDTNTLKVQLRTGEIDVAGPPPDSNLKEELSGFPRSSFHMNPGGYWEQIAINTESPPLDDRRVRQAVAYAVDRRQITDVVLRKQVPTLHSTVFPVLKDYAIPAFSHYVHDVDRSAQLLTEAGYTRQGEWWTKNGRPLKLVFKSTSGNQLRMKVAQLLQQQLRNAGIDMEITLEKPAIFFNQSGSKGNFQLGMYSWSVHLDPQQSLLFTCGQIPRKPNYEGSNYYRYCNEEVDRKLLKADRTVAVAARSKLIKDAQRLIADDVPVIPLYLRPETIAYSKRLHGVKSNVIAGATSMSEDWWVSE